MATRAKRSPPALSFSEAYHAAQSFLAHIDAAPSRLEEPADGIVEFIGDHYHGRLRYDDAPLTQAAILAFLKSTEESDKRVSILFSASGFTSSAELFGENLHVALFSIGAIGDILPISSAAHQLSPAEQFEPAFAQAIDEEEQDGRSGDGLAGEASGIADHEWLDCEVCGTTHHPEANYCHRCGTSMTKRSRAMPAARARASLESSTTPPLEVRKRATATRPASEAADVPDSNMRCRNCGSHDVEVVRV